MNCNNIETNKEIWKKIEDYENYMISNFGRIKSLKRNIILKPEVRRQYYSVQLYKNKKSKHFQIHRLVAITFIKNPHNLKYVNHKDENKLNNHVDNLEWCTASYNTNYGTAIKRAVEKKSIIINQYDKNGNYLNTYLSFMDAQRKTGIFNNNIVKCCKGERKTAGGYIWKYKKETL